MRVTGGKKAKHVNVEINRPINCHALNIIKYSEEDTAQYKKFS